MGRRVIAPTHHKWQGKVGKRWLPLLFTPTPLGKKAELGISPPVLGADF